MRHGGFAFVPGRNPMNELIVYLTTSSRLSHALSQGLTSWKFLSGVVSHADENVNGGRYIPRIEKGQVAFDRWEGLENRALHGRWFVRILGKCLAECHVVNGALPLAIIDDGVAAGDLFQEDVPRQLAGDISDFPTDGFLIVCHYERLYLTWGWFRMISM